MDCNQEYDLRATHHFQGFIFLQPGMQLTTSVRPDVIVPRQTLQRVAHYDVISVETYEHLVGDVDETRSRLLSDLIGPVTGVRLDYVASEALPYGVEERLRGGQFPALGCLVQTKNYTSAYLGQRASVTLV